uniref:Uncharacterized protein n=1 Tax=Podoviridae sp. ct8Lf7 TaxID=2827723 RepID=A0A8S5S0K9_9CAUD|nr:MAG TPA: hypothetical protein [Podoviridae sp. ct8Lf7]
MVSSILGETTEIFSLGKIRYITATPSRPIKI